MARHHKILTIDKLQRRNHILANGCILCLQNAEDVHHQFIHCSFTIKVLHVIFQLFVVDWVMPRTDTELFEHWKYGSSSYRGKVVWKLMLVATLWNVWLERNRRVFKR